MKTKNVLLLSAAMMLLVMAVSFLQTGEVEASPKRQNGSCPPNTQNTFITPQGTWPDDVIICTYLIPHVSVRGEPFGDWWPCDQHVVGYASRISAPNPLQVIYMPAADQYYGEWIQLRALVFARPFPIPGIPGPAQPGYLMDDVKITIDKYSTTDVYTIEKALSDYSYAQASYEYSLFTHYYRVYFINVVFFSTVGQGEYFRVTIDYDLAATKYDWGIASVRIGSPNDNQPLHCDIPGYEFPSTPVPTATLPATWTPQPTPGTATPTPITTPNPTSPGGTPPPEWTPTPLTFPTLPAENTPTPWPPYSIPTIDWPSAPPTTTPPLTIVAGGIPTAVSGVAEAIDVIENEWQPAIEFGQGAMDLDNSDTTGTSSPNVIIAEVAAVISVPVSYVKAIMTYLPNTAVYVTFLLLAASWVPFNYSVKLGLTIISRLFELIRRIIELIPGF